MRIVAALLLVFAAVPPLAAQSPAPESAGPPIVAEARSFMADYARALLAGDRAGISARYDRNGAYALGNGRKAFGPYARIVAQYASVQWQPPHRFEWRDLSYEPVGNDAVVIAGQFAWTRSEGAEPSIYSYTALLRRQDGALRIRLEDESSAPRRP